MEISVENTGTLGRRINITIPAEQIDSKINEKINSLTKTVKVDGFRPGKVPVNVIKQRFGQAVRDEIVSETLRTSLYDALMKKELNPAGTPVIEEVKMEQGQPLEYTASFEVYPEVKLSELSALNIEKIAAEITDADMDTMLENIRKQHANWKEASRKSKSGDRVTIDFEGFIDDKAFEGGTAKDVPVILGSNSMIPGFEDGIVGMANDEEKSLNLTFPENYPAKDLAGKDTVFKVKVTKIEEPELPGLDDAFAETMGVKEGGVAALTTQVKEHMQRELDNALKHQLKTQVFDKLLEANSVEVPQALIDREYEHLEHQVMPKGHKHDHASEDHERIPGILDEAKKRVSLSLLMAELIKSTEIKTDHERVRKLVEDTAKAYEKPDQVVAWFYSDPKNLANFEASVLEEQVVEMILDKATVKSLTKSYQDVMNPNQS